LRPTVSAGVVVVVVLLVLVAWFGAELITGGGLAGLASVFLAVGWRCGPWRWSHRAVVPRGKTPGAGPIGPVPGRGFGLGTLLP
jgi:hypothetical protein